MLLKWHFLIHNLENCHRFKLMYLLDKENDNQFRYIFLYAEYKAPMKTKEYDYKESIF